MVPAIMYGTILTFNQFNIIYFITNGGPYGRTEILVTQAFKLVNPNGLYGLAAAFSIMVFFILLVITLAQNRVARGLEGFRCLVPKPPRHRVWPHRRRERVRMHGWSKRPIARTSQCTVIEDILAHVALVLVAITVLFPVVWIVSMSLDGRNISRPTSLSIIPPNPSLAAYKRVLTEPQANNVMFSTMLKNSLALSIGVSVVVVVFAVTAAYAFARFHFPGRKWGLFLFIAVLMLPSVATLAPLSCCSAR